MCIALGLPVPGSPSQLGQGGGERLGIGACSKCLECMYQYLHIYTLIVITFSSALWKCFPLQSCPLKASIPVSLLLEKIQRSFLTSKDCQVLFSLRTCGPLSLAKLFKLLLAAYLEVSGSLWDFYHAKAGSDRCVTLC